MNIGTKVLKISTWELKGDFLSGKIVNVLHSMKGNWYEVLWDSNKPNCWVKAHSLVRDTPKRRKFLVQQSLAL